MNTTVDVIIPLHNDELFIGLAIKSVLAQTFQFNKLFVVNDHSTDASVAIVRELEKIDSRITILENSRIERSSARNTGIKASNAEYIAFLDSDDVWHPEKLERQLAFLGNNSNCGLIYCNYLMIDRNGNYLPDATILTASLRGQVFRNLLLENRISGSASAVLCRRQLFDLAGYFDENLNYGEDWDMWLRIARFTNFEYLGDDLVYIRARDKTHKRDDYFRRNYKRKQHLTVWSKWPRDAIDNQEIMCRLVGYMRYPHIGANLSIKDKKKRITVKKLRFCSQLDDQIVKIIFSYNSNGLYLPLIKEHLHFALQKIRPSRKRLKHRIKHLFFLTLHFGNRLQHKIRHQINLFLKACKSLVVGLFGKGRK
jgi:glycosyltransferase involved in cell wall biosynthesis